MKYDSATGKLLAQFNGDQNPAGDIYLNEALYPDGGLLIVARDAVANNQVLARYPNRVAAQSKNRVLAAALHPAMDGLGNIFLLDTQASVVYKFTSDGKYVTKFGSVGTGAGQFDYRALRIAIDNQNRLYVTDISGIKVFDSNGTFIESMSGDSIQGGIFDVCIGSNNEIYLVTSNDMIYKLARNTK